MKKIFVLMLFLLSCFSVYSTNIDSLKQIAKKSNLAKDWNEVAICAYQQEDTIQLKTAGEMAYRLAINENNLSEIGKAFTNFSELERFRGNMNEYYHNRKKALDFFVQAKDDGNQAVALANIGYYYTEQSKYDSAIEFYRKACDVALRLRDPDDVSILPSIYYNLSNNYLHLGQEDSCIHYIQKSKELAEQIAHIPVIIVANNILGMLAHAKNDFKKAIDYYMESLSLYEKIGEKEQIPFIYGNIAALYIDWNKPKQALEFSKKGLDYAQNQKMKRVYGNLLIRYGTDLVFNKEYSQGIDSIKKAVNIINDSSFAFTSAFLSLSAAYFELQQFDSSSFYLNKITRIEDKPLPERSQYYFWKGILAFNQNDNADAIWYLTKYVDVIESATSAAMRKSPYGFSILSEAYEKGPHDLEKALYYKKIAYDLQDSIHKHEHSHALADFAVHYETAEKELEISRLNEQKQQMLFYRWLMAGGIIILCLALLAAWIYNRFLRLRKEKEAALLSQRMEAKENEYQALINENERRLVQSYLEGLEVERNRISTELHDNVANEALLISMELEKSGQLSEKVSEKLQNLHAQVRNISHELNYPIFQHFSFPEILKDYVQGLNAATAFEVVLEMHSQEALAFLPDDVSGELYRIVQEAVNNALKHSQAKQIRIRIAIVEFGLKLMIEDDGIGFEPAESYSGIGLNIIRRRCNNLGGTCRIDSEIEKGTTILIEIPYGN